MDADAAIHRGVVRAIGKIAERRAINPVGIGRDPSDGLLGGEGMAGSRGVFRIAHASADADELRPDDAQ